MPLIPARNSWAQSGRQAVTAQTSTWRRSQFDGMAKTSLNRVKHNRRVAALQAKLLAEQVFLNAKRLMIGVERLSPALNYK
jgi:hypothetical protein